jgi:hypothetical protein
MSRATPEATEHCHWVTSLSVLPWAAAGATANKTLMKTCTNFAGHFDGRGSALVQYRVHQPMEEVQGFTRSHWMPQLGKYYVQ